MNGLSAQAGALLFGTILSRSGIPTRHGALTTKSVVKSGHGGPVTCLARDRGRGVLLSTNADGTLRVWDASSRMLLQRIAVTRHEIRSLALNPVTPHAVMVTTDGARAWQISVWKWETGTHLYDIALPSEPLFMRFSRTGTYLLCGLARFDSLCLFRSADGSPIPLALPAFGMVAFAEVSRSNRTLMTYELSGRLRYWDMVSGAVLHEAPTAPSLFDVVLTEDQRILVGHTTADVVGLDAMTGTERFSFASADIISLWNAHSYRKLFQLAVFADNGWAAVMPDGSFARSPTGREHVAILLKPLPPTDGGDATATP